MKTQTIGSGTHITKGGKKEKKQLFIVDGMKVMAYSNQSAVAAMIDFNQRMFAEK